MASFNPIKSLIYFLPEYFFFRLKRRSDEGPKPHVIECCQLFKNEEFHINRILKEGIRTQGELYFLAQRIRSHFPRIYLPSSEVANLVTAFELLLNLEITNIDQLIRHLSTTFPTISQMESPFRAGYEPSPRVCEVFLRDKIRIAYRYMNENDSVYWMFTRQVANCLLYLFREGELSIPLPVLMEINRLLRKWI